MLWPGQDAQIVMMYKIVIENVFCRGSHEPVIAHLVFNLTSKVETENRGKGLQMILKVGHPKIISTKIAKQKILM